MATLLYIIYCIRHTYAIKSMEVISMGQMKLTIQECIDGILDKMKKLGYSQSTITQYTTRFNRFRIYCESFDEQYFSEWIALQYLNDEFDFKLSDLLESTNYSKEHSIHVRVLRLISHFNEDQTFIPRYSRHHASVESNTTWSPIYQRYISDIKSKDYSTSTIRRKESVIRKSIDFFIQRGIQSEEMLSRQVLKELVSKMIGDAPKSLCQEVGILKSFFDFAYQESFFNTNFSDLIPNVTQPHFANIPVSWEINDVKKY